jgi:hypothetical protein
MTAPTDPVTRARQLLDAATEGDWDQVGATVEKEVDVGWCIVVAECDKVADAALIAAAPRLLANWLAREDTDVLSVYPDLVLQLRSLSDRSCNAAADIIEQLAAERDRLADENRALRELAGFLIDACATHRIDVPINSSLLDLAADIAAAALAAADRGVTDGEAT